VGVDSLGKGLSSARGKHLAMPSYNLQGTVWGSFLSLPAVVTTRNFCLDWLKAMSFCLDILTVGVCVTVCVCAYYM